MDRDPNTVSPSIDEKVCKSEAHVFDKQQQHFLNLNFATCLSIKLSKFTGKKRSKIDEISN